MKKTLLLISTFAFATLQAQVSQVKDIYGGATSSIPAYLKNRIVHNGKIIMAANGSATYSTQLWESDGTNAGTVQLKKISNANTASNPQGFFYFAPTNKVYFSANNGVNSNGTNNYELWETDGTLAGTVMTKECNPATINPGGYPTEFVIFGSNFYFRANNGTAGVELWKSDGTTAGTSMISNINPGGAASTPANFTVVGSKLFFTANDGTNGKELYVTTGPTAGTITQIDVAAGATSSGVDNLVSFNGLCYFTANGVDGVEVWKSDGTVGGTNVVTDIYTGFMSSDPDDLYVYNNELYFSATNPTYGRELYKLNTSNVVTLVKDTNPGANAGITPAFAGFFTYNGSLFFIANNGVNGAELWKTDGTTVNTAMLKELNPTGNCNIANIIIYNGKMVFQAQDGVTGTELYISDGTANGTGLANDIYPGATGSFPKDFVIYNSELYFTATNANGAELWKATTLTLGNSQFEKVNTEASLYPNPAKDYFQIANVQDIKAVSIYNAQGQLVKLYTNQELYSTQDLSKGIYMVKIDSEIQTSTQKLIIK